MNKSNGMAHKNIESPRKNFQVMVIDDDEFQIDFISDLLGNFGFWNTVAAIDGEDALKKIHHLQPDLLICDINMPGMDGFDLMNSLANCKFKGSLILVSGQGERMRHSAALVAQLSTCNYLGDLEKPVNKLKLKSLLDKLHC